MFILSLWRIIKVIQMFYNYGEISMDKFGLNSSITNEISELGKKYSIVQIKIFGSRARGNYMERSDIDLAIFGGGVAGFLLEADERIPTLLKFDIVNMNNLV